jgi:hypothetical protein
MSDTPESSSSSSRAKRSWRRYSLRALLVIVLFAAVYFGWVAYRVRQFHEQAAFIADLRARGFTIGTETVEQEWFWQPLVGDNAVQVKKADLAEAISSSRTDGLSVEDFERLRTWTNLEVLQLCGASVNDETLAVVGTFRKLHSLGLFTTAVTGDGLRHWEPLAKLAHLTITCNSQDDFSRCASLNDGLLRLIGEPREFTNISLMGIPIREEVLRKIGTHCPDLKGLYLQKCGIDDRGLAHLERLSSLHGLELSDNAAITDRGLKHLHELRSLNYLRASGTSASEEGIALLRRKLPGANAINFD